MPAEDPPVAGAADCVIHLRWEAGRVSGHVQLPGGPVHGFTNLLGLLGLIEAARATSLYPSNPSGDANA